MVLFEKDYNEIESMIFDEIGNDSADRATELEYTKGDETLYIYCNLCVQTEQVELTRDEYDRVEYGEEIVGASLAVEEFVCYNEDGDLTSCNLDAKKLMNEVEEAYRQPFYQQILNKINKDGQPSERDMWAWMTDKNIKDIKLPSKKGELVRL